MDQDITGRFEVTIHSKNDCSDEGELVHSKITGGSFPNEDFSTFIQLVQMAVD